MLLRQTKIEDISEVTNQMALQLIVAQKNRENMMNKNTVLAWATFIMILVGLALIALGAFRYDDVAGWGFAAVGIGFFAIAWVFNALKGRM